MPYIVRKKFTFEQYVRKTIGDPDNILFDIDELESYIEKYADQCPTTAQPSANNLKYHIDRGRSQDPIYDVVVTSGVTGAVYIVDEPASLVKFDPDDAECTAASPSDGDLIEVQFYRVCINELFKDLFYTLSANHAKLTQAYSIMGVSMDLKDLSKAFFDKAAAYAAGGIK